MLGPVTINDALSVEELKRCLDQQKIPERVLSEDKDGHATGTVLLSCHHWANVDLTPRTILASYLALWLKDAWLLLR